jgi:hypothetical protein
VSGLYEDLISDPFVSKFMQREILDRDYEGLEEMIKGSFLESYLLVRELCGQLVGKDAAEWSAILVYTVTMGLSQFRPIGMTISPSSARWRDLDSMARLILAQVFPKNDWSRTRRGRASGKPRRSSALQDK